MKTTRAFLLASLALLQTSWGFADANDAFQFFQEEAKVVTASRRSQRVREAPAAVEVITAEDIRNSGAVNLWDLMRFRAGMNVIDARSGDGNRAIVSVRGFPAEFVDQLLVLLDGRSVYTGLSGGAVWEQIPVQPQDIERIEIVRGPNAALYGSNAGLGVINIITKKPEGKGRLSGEALAGNRGLQRYQTAVEDTYRGGAYRLSFLHEVQQGNPTPAGFEGNDFVFSNKGNLRSRWALTDQSNLELFAGGSWDTLGIIDVANPQGRFRHHFQMLKYGYALASNSSIETLVSRRDDVRTFDQIFGGLTTVREYQYDAEATHHLGWMDDKMQTVYGGSLRYTGVESDMLFAGNPRHKNAISRGFASQSWQILPPLDLVGAVSLEHSDTGGLQPAYQAAGVYTVRENHTFRVSYGQAPTIPTIYRQSSNNRASALVQLVGGAVKPAKLRSYEVSYQGATLENRLLLEANVFYMDVQQLSETVTQSFVFTPAPLLTLTFDNEDKAIARGSEVKGTYRWDDRHSVYANYTYETISDAKAQTDTSLGTPPHKVNLGTVMGLGHGFSASANAGYQDRHTLYSQATNVTLPIHAYWRLDARLGYKPRPNLELFMACQNMTENRHTEFPDGLEVPRTFLGGMSIAFGGTR